MAFLNNKKRSILNQYVNNDNVASIQKLYDVVKVSYKGSTSLSRIVNPVLIF